jgi:Fic family protein
VKIATFVYEFLSIHPFQDGNGRLSRLLTTLLLMQSGYTWIQYISFEHEIERQKQLYYNTLRQCQATRPGEDVSPWVNFFLNCIKLLTDKLLSKLKEIGSESQLHAKEKAVLAYVNLHPGAQSGDISKSLKMPIPTVKRLLKQLVEMNLIEKHGVGRGTYYLMC